MGPDSPKVSKPIQEAEVLSAQKKWGEGIVEIGNLAGNPSEYTAKAQSVIDTLYGYKTGPVLFKPTKAAVKPFRLDPVAALSYFVSGNTDFAVDGRPLREQWRALGGYHCARAGELLLYGYRWQGDQGGVHLRLLPRLCRPAAHQFAPLLLAFQASVSAKRGCFPFFVRASIYVIAKRYAIALLAMPRCPRHVG